MAKFLLEDMLKEIGIQNTKVAEEIGEGAGEVATPETKKEMKKEKEVKEEKAEEVADSKKEASVTPVEDLMKVASALAEQEKDMLVKQAELIGATLCDSFVNRLSQYEKAAEQKVVEKTASVESFSDENFMNKIAAEIEKDPDAQASFQQGYNDKIAELIEKDPKVKEAMLAEMEKNANEIIKIGSELQNKGFVDASKALKKALA